MAVTHTPAKTTRSAAGRRKGDEAKEVRIGMKVRHARRVQGMKLRDVAAELECSESYLSKIENDVLRPSLSMLHRLVQVLNINIASLFADNPQAEQVRIVRAKDRPVIRTHPLRANAGIELERLIADTTGALLECNIHCVDAGATSGGTIEHEGEELGFVLEGSLELIVEGASYVLNEGDCFFFESKLKHRYRNPGGKLTRVLWVCTPPTF
jgi:transcriptional regulator with XRE-family HTH domain